jgi:flagellar protein FliS
MNAYTAFKKNDFESASPERIMLKLFEGAVIRLKQARQEYFEGEVLLARELRSQALAIIVELDNSLDRENGSPEIVEQLDGLYAYMIREINTSTAKDDFDRLGSVIDCLHTLYEGFEDAVAQVASGVAKENAHLAAETSKPSREVNLHG